jgi:hypothetical protein
MTDESAASAAQLQGRVQEQLAGLSLLEYGRWAYYPWSRQLVHVLPEAEFRPLRSDCNRYKITPTVLLFPRRKAPGGR